MPVAAKRPCNHPGCPKLVQKGYCEAHQKKRNQERNREKGSSTQRGYDRQWRKARLVFLQSNPLCKYCENEGRVVSAEVVDHIKPHKNDKELFWDRDNWQSLCKYHHDLKTATEDGGFGRQRGGGE